MSGESIEEVPVVYEQVSQNLRDWYQVAEEKPGVDLRDEVKHRPSEKNELN